VIRLMLRVIYQAASGKAQISPKDVLFFDVANKETLHGNWNDAILAQAIEVGCERLRQMLGSQAA
jgi:hypothetical protein